MPITIQQIKELEEKQALIKELEADITNLSTQIEDARTSIEAYKSSLYESVLQKTLTTRSQKMQAEEIKALQEREKELAPELISLCKQEFKSFLTSSDLKDLIDVFCKTYEFDSCTITVSQDISDMVSGYDVDPTLPELSVYVSYQDFATLTLSWKELSLLLVSTVLERALSLELTIS